MHVTWYIYKSFFCIEHQITMETIPLLDETSIKEIVPTLGVRLRLWEKIKAYTKPLVVMQTLETNETEVIILIYL